MITEREKTEVLNTTTGMKGEAVRGRTGRTIVIDIVAIIGPDFLGDRLHETDILVGNEAHRHILH